ncbi:hypothetical protein LTR35_000224 [Friedmanniomyces endolithicus]|uniref:Uncharacterized protein n=1 Tax=Friedmanniomyces endolithicus TaxID=329885 RepID=A0AAN6FWH7_9PEZI|nr:hypothetical protein LTS00_011062 [Friedmanniomyces endolithicus]KAK0293620.1 hypothetical protein LTR35_000224 [Friedmanniomyces endolithicus]KAK0324136.1 hypothetical protein LTR82_004572 [Friedmanniomyces endolithicus]KAK0992926.1 hypothetical protein LTR54_011246 [Friedmanniomyces endolithicus]
MQRVSSDVLQELQHQGEGQAQQQGRAGGAEGGGRGGVGPLTSPTSAPSLAFTAPDSPYAESSSPPTPFLGKTFWQTREFAPETPGRGHGDVPDEWQLSPQGAWVRPGSGRRATPSPSPSPAAETVPSQLLGGRAGSDADFLMEGPPESHGCTPSPAEYHTACKVSTELRLRSLLSSARPSRYVVPVKQYQEADSPPKTPASGTSSESKSSDASSFAYILRNNRADTRLLHKKSQPAAYLNKRTPLAGRPFIPQRSLSYYKPKVVEDTLLPDVSAPTALQQQQQQTASLTATEFIQAAKDSTTKTTVQRSVSPARRLQAPRSVPSSESLHRSEASTPSRLTPLESSNKPPGLTRQPTMKDSLKPLSLPPIFRTNAVKRPNLGTTESTRSSKLNRRPQHLSLPMPTIRKVEALPEQIHFHKVTPPEAEPRTPGVSHFQRGDHYFRTFGNNTVYMKTFTPTMIPSESGQPSPASITPLPKPVGFLPMRRPGDSIASGQWKRKRSSVFRFNRKTAVTDSNYQPPKSGHLSARSTRLAPAIAVSPPFESTGKCRRSLRTSSESSLPTYFAQPIRSHRSPVTTPSLFASPMGTAVGTSAPRQSLGHRRTWSQKSSESSVSPGSQPHSRRPRLRHQATLADIADSDPPAVILDGNEVQNVPTTFVPGSLSRSNTLDRDNYHQSKATGTGTVHWLPDEEPRSPPRQHPQATSEGKRRSTFKQVFRDLRHSASARSFGSVAETPQRDSLGQRTSLFPLGSAATKASQISILSPRPREPRERLELRVTNFYQTPYSQRVANNRRTELNQIKVFVEEALLDDNDDTIMGFELNVPDHLPSSLLCPLNPRHKSGGNAICPMHGRKKLRTPGLSKAQTMAAPKNGGPRIVYEGVAGEPGRRATQVTDMDGGKSPRSVLETWYS